LWLIFLPETATYSIPLFSIACQRLYGKPEALNWNGNAEADPESLVIPKREKYIAMVIKP
jgi:hypothetical protein